ncbi:MAG TPA: hypothetical protein VH540_10685 [Ktedonobacterales bacterium]|jgi:hypothetical protein
MTHPLFQENTPASQSLVICPFCHSSDTEFFSLFGSQLLTAQYYCRACHTPFEQVKGEAVLADAARRDLANPSVPQMNAEPGDEESAIAEEKR